MIVDLLERTVQTQINMGAFGVSGTDTPPYAPSIAFNADASRLALGYSRERHDGNVARLNWNIALFDATTGESIAHVQGPSAITAPTSERYGLGSNTRISHVTSDYVDFYLVPEGTDFSGPTTIFRWYVTRDELIATANGAHNHGDRLRGLNASVFPYRHPQLGTDIVPCGPYPLPTSNSVIVYDPQTELRAAVYAADVGQNVVEAHFSGNSDNKLFLGQHDI